MSRDMRPRANLDQAAAWDGPEGEYWASHAERYERATLRHRRRLLAAGVVSAGDAVLDIGCGSGALTRDAVRSAHASSALGVDLSARMVQRAREVTADEGVSNVVFEQADAQTHRFPDGAYDVTVSCFGAMFFDDPVAAFSNIARACRPGGGMALLAWRDLGRNEWLTALRAALSVGRSLPEPPVGVPGPFGLADDTRMRTVLGQAGFVDVDVAAVEDVVDFGPDAATAYEFILGMGITTGLTQDLDATTKSKALDRLRATIAAHQTDDGVLFDSSAWLVRARRR